MADWNTPDRICQTLLQCQQNGINAYQYAHRENPLKDLENFRSKGGNMHLIATDPDTGSRGRSGAAQRSHGALPPRRKDRRPLPRRARWTRRRSTPRELRQAGVRVGIGTHKPEVVEYVEEHGWDVDFYMLCAYNRTRTPEEYSQDAGRAARCPLRTFILKPILPAPTRWRAKLPRPASCSKSSPPAACARSPEEVDKAFKQAFDSIKPQDCVVVGMFPRFKDEIKENCDRVRRILNHNA